MRKTQQSLSVVGVTGDVFVFPVFHRSGRIVADLGGRFSGWHAVWGKNLEELRQRVNRIVLLGFGWNARIFGEL